MGSQKTAASKPLLLTLLAVVLVGAAFYVYNGARARAEENDIPGLVKPPPGLTPVTEEEKSRVPQPMGMRE